MITRIDAIPFCLDRLPDRRLLVVAGDDLLVRSHDGTLSTYAKLGALSTNPWNDIVSDGRGNTYVNNIGFDFRTVNSHRASSRSSGRTGQSAKLPKASLSRMAWQ